MGHATDGTGHVVGVHDPCVGSENAPEWGRLASFSIGHGPLLLVPFGPLGTRFTVPAMLAARTRRAFGTTLFVHDGAVRSLE